MRTIGLSLIATLLAALPGRAQVRADPGVVIGNRIAVRVNVTLADEDNPYYPVRNVTVAFTRSPADTVVGRTDEAGVVTVLLTPGNYTVATTAPVAWKGAWYSWTLPISVRADMPAVEFSRSNARRGSSSAIAAPPPASRPTQTTGDGAGAGSTAGTSSGGAIRWLSMEAGAEGGVAQVGEGDGSDAGYGASGSFVGGLGPVALALGYRYTRIRYGDGLEPGSMRGGTVELRYHLRPGAAPIRPYVGGLASFGRWYDSESLSDESSSMRMFGGTVGAQFGLATSVRLHLAATVAGTNVQSETTGNGLFATGHVGLTFDIFSPAR